MCSSFREPDHPQVGFQCVQLAHSGGIVVRKIRARTCTDLKNIPFSKWDDLLADLLDGRRIAEHIHKAGIDKVSVERH
jgi:hypothetical protein